MKKIVTILIVIFCTFTANSEDRGMVFGAKFSAGVSNLDNDGVSMEYKFSYSGGVLLQIPITTNFSIRPELVFAAKGASNTNNIYRDSTASTVITKTNVSYLELPIMACFENKSFSVLVGPYFAVKVNDAFSSEIDRIEFTPKYNAFDFGIGGGLEIPIQKNLAVDLRFTYGLMSIISSENIPKRISAIYTDKLRNYGIQLGLVFTI